MGGICTAIVLAGRLDRRSSFGGVVVEKRKAAIGQARARLAGSLAGQTTEAPGHMRRIVGRAPGPERGRAGAARAATQKRVVVVGPAALRRRVRSLARRPQSGLVVVREAAQLGDVVPTLGPGACDVLIASLESDLEAALVTLAPVARHVGIVIVNRTYEPASSIAALRAGVPALLPSGCTGEEMLEAIHAVTDGHVWIPPIVQGYLVDRLQRVKADGLTLREREIIREVALGRRNREVARSLHISADTVKKHLNTIFHKLMVRNRVDLALRAVELGMVSGYGPLAAKPAKPRPGLGDP